MNILMFDRYHFIGKKINFIIKTLQENHNVFNHASVDLIGSTSFSKKEIEYLQTALLPEISRKHWKHYTRLDKNTIEKTRNNFITDLKKMVGHLEEQVRKHKIDVLITDGNHLLPYVACDIIKKRHHVSVVGVENSFDIKKIYMDAFGGIGNEMLEMRKAWEKKKNYCINEFQINDLNRRVKNRGQVGQSINRKKEYLDIYIYNKLKMKKDKKIALIIGQVDSDSVVCRDLKNLKNIDNFFQICLEDCRKNDLQMIFRLHPWDAIFGKDITANFFKNKKEEDFQVIKAKEINTYDLLNYVDIVICITSQFGLESALMGKPVITMGDAFYNISGGFFVAENNNLDNEIKKVFSEDYSKKIENVKRFYSFLYGDYLVGCYEEDKNKIKRKIEVSKGV